MSSFEEYRKAEKPLPKDYIAWQLYGAGFENVGKNGMPARLSLRPPEDNEILLRVDALGLCQSDIKIINQGRSHARLRGRDLAKDPTVLGHECAATVVGVGRQWKDKFQIGERYVVQADIYYQGLNYAFGYLIPGGLAQYTYLDERALAGDEGCYLLPVRPETGYSESALSEPWACVEMSYNVQERCAPGAGEQLIVADDAAPWRALAPNACVVPRNLEGLDGAAAFDDILLPEPTPELVNALAPRLKRDGIMFLFGPPAEDGVVTLDVGRIHYEGVRFYGGGPDLAGIQKANERYDLKPGGAALFIGAGGPMGQMHVQRAIETPGGPKHVVVTDLDRGRLDHIAARFKDLADSKGVELHTFAPTEFESQEAMDARIRDLAPSGYSDIIVMAPVAALVSGAMQFAADEALVNVFAGVGAGNMADMKLGDLCRGVKVFGTSGSRVSDMRKVLDMVEDRQLNTDMSVAAIGGLNAAREGLEGVRDARFPGKTVIYPQIFDMPLMAIDEIPGRIPQLKDKLGPNNTWSREAERALLELYAQ